MPSFGHGADATSRRSAATISCFAMALALAAACGVVSSAPEPGVAGSGASEADTVDAGPRAPDDAVAPADPCALDVIGPALLDAESGPVLVVYRVHDGQLMDVCEGNPLAVVEESWLALTEISPPEQLDSIALFAGFEADEGEDTVAFAAPLPVDDNNPAHTELATLFLIAVDVVSAEQDETELLVTMAHEISHVITQTATQLDREVAPEACPTFHNGLGCFDDDAYITAWIDEFWTGDELAGLPDDGSTDAAGGERRCALDARHLGSYGASHPEEDFAESFAAYVLAIEVEQEVRPRIDFFDDFPELVAFRDRAAAAGHAELDYEFDRCG